MKICEWCGKEHDGSYKTGRFCSSYCSHAYSANKRKENWRENVSKALTGNKNNPKGWKSFLEKNGYLTEDGTYTDEYREYCSERTKRMKTGCFFNPSFCKPKSEEQKKHMVATIRKTREENKANGKVYPGWVVRNGEESINETFTKEFLETNKIQFEQEVLIHKADLDNTIGHGYYKLDFLIDGKIDLEIDGKQHTYPERKERDIIRDTVLKEHGYIVYRILINVQKEKRIEKLQEKLDEFLEWYRIL